MSSYFSSLDSDGSITSICVDYAIPDESVTVSVNPSSTTVVPKKEKNPNE